MQQRVAKYHENRLRLIDEMLGQGTDEDLADLKQMVMDRADQQTRSHLADKDPRTNRWLRELIYDALTEWKKQK